MWPLYHPSSQWGGEKSGKKKAKLVGQDKDSFIEQQRNSNNNNTDKNKRIGRATLLLPDA